MKNRIMRLLMGLGVIIFAIVVPIIVISLQYSLFDKIQGSSTPVKVIGIIIMVGLVCIITFRKFIHDAIHNMEFGFFKCILMAISRLWIYILLVVLIRVVENNLDSLKNCFDWFLTSAVAAYCIFEPLYYKYDNLVREENQKKIVKEALGDAKNG